MDNLELTNEQLQVIHHPIGMHARVLAVAGSGKSTTLAYRVQYLVMGKGVPPSSIRVLMYNALARKEFRAKLEKTGLPASHQPEVHTFHSFCYKVIRSMMKQGVLPELLHFWIGDKEELVRLTCKHAIYLLARDNKIPSCGVDLELALNTISLWKGALLPPKRAGSNTSKCLPTVYSEFERLRLKQTAITFDDFIPLALDFLLSTQQTHIHWCHGIRQLLIDEYQDINYGQEKLIEVLARDQADVMVVGDDDQTIYEWRGARPNYILNDFAEVFSFKPIREYCLSHSFRFGPTIAKAASSVIACNTNRVEKVVVAHIDKPGFVHLLNGGYASTRTLAEQVQALTQTDEVAPAEIAVLGRLYSQMDDLEGEFLLRNIPYRVDGHKPFFKRQEIQSLLDYIRIALCYDRPLNRESSKMLLRIANKPYRALSLAYLMKFIRCGMREQMSIHKMFETFVPKPQSGYLNRGPGESLRQLWFAIEGLEQKVSSPSALAGEILDWLIEEVDYLYAFEDYYGQGLHAEQKMQAVQNFVNYVTYLQLSPIGLLEHISQLDTTQGAVYEEQIRFTTIHRTKGLEYEYVILPNCDENAHPYLKGERSSIYDLEGEYQEEQVSSPLESERRLFYVAITRARKGVLIGTSADPSRFIQELQLQEGETI